MLNIENQNQHSLPVSSTFETVGTGLREFKDRNLLAVERGEGVPNVMKVTRKNGETQPSISANRCTGTVKWFNPTKGFGFITPDCGDIDVFVHQSEIQLPGFRSLAQGEPVEYQLYDGEKGPKALQVTGPDGTQVKGAPRQTKQKVETNKAFTPDNTTSTSPARYIRVGNHFIQVASNTQVPVSTPVLAPTQMTPALPTMYSTPTPATSFSHYILTNSAMPGQMPYDMSAMPMSPTPMVLEQTPQLPMSPPTQYFPFTQFGMNPSTPLTQVGMSPSTPTPQFAYQGQSGTPMQMNFVSSPQVDYSQLQTSMENPFDLTNSFFNQNEHLSMGMDIASPIMSPLHG